MLDAPYLARQVDDAALRKAVNAGRYAQDDTVPKQIARLLLVGLAVVIGYGILLLLQNFSSETKPPTSASVTLTTAPNSAPLNAAQREAQAPPPAPVSASAPPPPDFRGVKWGSRPALWMTRIGGPSGANKLSTWKNSKKSKSPPFMNVPVAEEDYFFENNKLFAGEMFIDGAENFETLKTALRKALGTPTSSDDRLQIYKWQWRDPSVFLSLSYQSKIYRATVHIEKEGPP
jgi:hypothetical protein